MPWAQRVTTSAGVGEGVAIAPDLLLTCEHVVRGDDTARVRAPSGVDVPFEVLDRDKDMDVAVLVPCGGVAALGEEAVVVPRALWRGRWPSVDPGFDAVWAESCTDEVDTPRRAEIDVQRGHRREARVEFVVERDRQGVRRG